MNILIVSEYSYPHVAGGELIKWELIKGLAKKGHKIYVITSKLPGCGKYEVVNGIEINRPFTSCNIEGRGSVFSIGAPLKRIIFMFRLFPYINTFIKDHSIDIIYNIGYISALPTSVLARKNHKPSVCSIHSYCGKTWFKISNPLYATFCYLGEKFIIKFSRFDALHCPSAIVAKQLSSDNQLSDPIIIHNPIASEIIAQVNNTTDSESIRKTLEIKPDEIFLLFVGSLFKVKNIDGLLKTLAKLIINYKLVIVGEGPESSQIKNLAINLGIENKIKLLGQKPHLETLKIIKSCDIFILPSHSEIFPNTILEALSLNKPVIATNVGGVSEIISKNLHLVDINNVEQMNDAINNINITQEDNFAAQFSLDRIVSEYETMFYSILQLK